MEIKNLNLDEMVAPNRTVTLKGIRHEVQDMSVEGFIEFSRLSAEISERSAKANAEGKDLSVRENVDTMIAVVKMALPSIDDETLRALKLVQLNALIDFLNGVLDDPEKPGNQEEGATQGKS